MPPMNRIVDAALKGIIEAQNQYEDWSGGCWLWEAPEYFVTTSIARQMTKFRPSSLYWTLENNVRQAIDESGGLPRGRPPLALRIDGRFDILLWEGEIPRVAIEVKNQVNSYGGILADVERICAVLDKQRGKSIKDGIVCFYTSRYKEDDRQGARSSVKHRLATTEEKAGQYVEMMGMTLKQFKRSRVECVEDSAWAAAVFHIQS